MILAILIAIILFATVACLWNQGLWTAVIAFFNTMTAALVASNVFEPVADALPRWFREGNSGDFLALWGVFIVVVAVLRLITDFASRSNVRFIWPVDRAGAVVFALWTGWVLSCFTLMSLHVAPLPRTALFGSFMETPDVESRHVLVGPDRLWLAFLHAQSQGGLARGDDSVFDPEGTFVYRYAARRLASETQK